MWIETGTSPTVYRYVDWLLTVPLQVVEFYLILAAVTTVRGGVFFKLLISSLVMLIAGYLGEAGLAPVLPAFVIGCAAWLYIIYEIFAGETSKINAASGNVASQTAFFCNEMDFNSWLGNLSSWILSWLFRWRS